MTHRQKRQARRGLTVVETSVVLSLVFLFMFGIFEYGRFVMVRELTENAVREGARYAIVNTANLPSSGPSDQYVKNQVDLSMVGLQGQVTGYAVTVWAADASGNPTVGNWYDGIFGQGIGVQVTGSYIPVTPSMLMMPSSIPINVRSVMSSEAN